MVLFLPQLVEVVRVIDLFVTQRLDTELVLRACSLQFELF